MKSVLSFLQPFVRNAINERLYLNILPDNKLSIEAKDEIKANRIIELSECSPGTGYAYTTIVPGSVGRRYVLPYPTETFYTYTGATLTQSTVTPGYNGSIQITSFYSCP
jgi:hypothetical protein